MLGSHLLDFHKCAGRSTHPTALPLLPKFYKIHLAAAVLLVDVLLLLFLVLPATCRTAPLPYVPPLPMSHIALKFLVDVHLVRHLVCLTFYFLPW